MPVPLAPRAERLAATLALALALALSRVAVTAAPAGADPAFSPAVLVAPLVLPGCTSMSPGAIAWAAAEPDEAGRNLVEDGVAALGPRGPGPVTTIGPSSGTASCPAVAGSGSTALAVSQVFEPPVDDATVQNADAGELWAVSPGGTPVDLGVAGLRPSVATAADGSAVVAFLGPAGTGADGGPTYSLRVVQRQGTGPFGAPATIAGPDSDDGSATGPSRYPLIVWPRVVMDDDGAAVVAWAPLEAGGAASLVQVSEAAPGAPFAPVQTIYPGDPVNGEALVNYLLLAGNGGGGHFLQWAADPAGDVQGLGLLTQSSLSSPFSSVASPFSWPLVDQSPAPAISALGIDAAGDLFELLSPDGDDTGGPTGVLEYAPLVVAERRPAATAWTQQTLVTSSGFDVAEDPVFAVRSDGEAAAAWVDAGVGPDGGLVRDVQVSIAPPGQPFGPPITLSGLAPIAQQPALAFGADGRLRVAWVGGTALAQNNGPLVVSTEGAAPHGPASADGPPPALRLFAQRQQRDSASLTVRVQSAAGSLVRVQAFILGIAPVRSGGRLLPDGGQGYPQLGGIAPDSAAKIMPAAGAAAMRVPLADDWSAASQAQRLGRGPYQVRIVAYATTQLGASGVASTVVRVPGAG